MEKCPETWCMCDSQHQCCGHALEDRSSGRFLVLNVPLILNRSFSMGFSSRVGPFDNYVITLMKFLEIKIQNHEGWARLRIQRHKIQRRVISDTQNPPVHDWANRQLPCSWNFKDVVSKWISRIVGTSLNNSSRYCFCYKLLFPDNCFVSNEKYLFVDLQELHAHLISSDTHEIRIFGKLRLFGYWH